MVVINYVCATCKTNDIPNSLSCNMYYLLKSITSQSISISHKSQFALRDLTAYDTLCLRSSIQTRKNS